MPSLDQITTFRVSEIHSRNHLAWANRPPSGLAFEAHRLVLRTPFEAPVFLRATAISPIRTREPSPDSALIHELASRRCDQFGWLSEVGMRS